MIQNDLVNSTQKSTEHMEGTDMGKESEKKKQINVHV